MANPERGEVPVDLYGRRFTFRLSLNGLRSLKETLGSTVHQWMAQKGHEMDPDDLLEILVVGLRTENGDKVDRETIGDLVDARTLPYFARVLSESFGVSKDDLDKRLAEATTEGNDGPLLKSVKGG